MPRRVMKQKSFFSDFQTLKLTISSWLDCALRGDEAVYWVSIGQQWLVLEHNILNLTFMTDEIISL